MYSLELQKIYFPLHVVFNMQKKKKRLLIKLSPCAVKKQKEIFTLWILSSHNPLISDLVYFLTRDFFRSFLVCKDLFLILTGYLLVFILPCFNYNANVNVAHMLFFTFSIYFLFLSLF